MSKKNILLIVLGLAIIVALMIVIVYTDEKKVVKSDNEGVDVSDIIEFDEKKVLEESEFEDPFQETMPIKVKVPEVNEVLSEEVRKEIAVPEIVVEAAPGVEAKYRSFDIKAEGGKYIPSKIIANVGDTIHVNFTAVDKDYDIVFPSYGMLLRAKVGQTKLLQFQAVKSGSFAFYCDSCGGPESETRGSFIIVE